MLGACAMAVRTQGGYKAPMGALWKKQGSKYGRGRFARELFNGRYQPGELLQLSNTAATYEIDEEALLNIFLECQSLGLVKLSKKKTAIVCAPNPKEMQEAYEIRAGLEEISGRTAATAFKGNTGRLRYELAAMRAALEERDLDACAERRAFACLEFLGGRSPYASNSRKGDAKSTCGGGLSSAHCRGA